MAVLEAYLEFFIGADAFLVELTESERVLELGLGFFCVFGHNC